MSTEDARKLVFRVASDPALLRRLESVASQGEADPNACAQLARMVAELDPNVSIADCQAVRAEFGRLDAAALQTTHPALDHDLVAQTARAQGVDTAKWVNQAATATCNLCTA